MISLPSCAARNILVTNVPAASVESVSEHALALFFALRRTELEQLGGWQIQLGWGGESRGCGGVSEEGFKIYWHEQRTNIWRYFLEKAATPQGAPIYSSDAFDG